MLVRIFCSRKRRSLAQSSSSKEASTAKDIDQVLSIFLLLRYSIFLTRPYSYQGALEAGNTTSRKSASGKLCLKLMSYYLPTTSRHFVSFNRNTGIFGAIQAEPTPHRKGVCFLSTSTNAEGDTPVILPWRVDSDIYDGKSF